MVLDLETTKKPKHLRKLSRLIAYVRWHEEQKLAKVVLIGDPQQRADPLTKITRSPSKHWKMVEWIQGTHEQVERFQQLATQRGQAREGTLEQQRQIRMYFAGLATIERMQRSLEEETTTAATQRRLRNTIKNAEESALTKNLRDRMRRDTEPRQKKGRSKVRKLNRDERKQLLIDSGWEYWQQVDAAPAQKRARTEAETRAQKRYQERFGEGDASMAEEQSTKTSRKRQRAPEQSAAETRDDTDRAKMTHDGHKKTPRQGQSRSKKSQKWWNKYGLNN
jgi:hypothetical protein